MDGSHHELIGYPPIDRWAAGRGQTTSAGCAMPRWPTRLLIIMVALAACSADSDARKSDPVLVTASDSSRGAVASEDTVLSVDAALRKFREGLQQPSQFADAATGRVDLARRFVAALAAHDTNALARLHITRAEFAWLYYPENPISRPPYSLPAGIAWFELHGNSEKGLHRALRAYGGRQLEYRGLDCPNEPMRYGQNVLWTKCSVRVRDEAAVDQRVQLFATIVERDGRFKIASAANDL